jgi:hypothetical protein
VFENKFLITGDFNAKHRCWGSKTINYKGVKLYQRIRDRQLSVFLTGRPTFWLSDINKIPDILGIGIANINGNRLQTAEILELSSNHTLVLFTINDKANI